MNIMKTIKSLFEKSVVSRTTYTYYYAINNGNILSLGEELPAECEADNTDITKEQYALISVRESGYSYVSDVEMLPDGTTCVDAQASALDKIENNKNNIMNVRVCKACNKKFAKRQVFQEIASYSYYSKSATPIERVNVDTPSDEDKVNVEYNVNILKSSLKEGLVYGIVYSPNIKDTHGDWTSAEEIERAAHEFLPVALRAGTSGWTDVNHKDAVDDVELVESYIAQSDFAFETGEKVSKGSWVIAARVNNAELKKSIENKEITGFSLEGTGYKLDIDNTTQGKVA